MKPSSVWIRRFSFHWATSFPWQYTHNFGCESVPIKYNIIFFLRFSIYLTGLFAARFTQINVFIYSITYTSTTLTRIYFYLSVNKTILIVGLVYRLCTRCRWMRAKNTNFQPIFMYSLQHCEHVFGWVENNAKILLTSVQHVAEKKNIYIFCQIHRLRYCPPVHATAVPVNTLFFFCSPVFCQT